MATSKLSHVSKENLNFSRLCKLLVDCGTKVLRDVFDSIHPPASLGSHLVDSKNHVILKKLQSKRILKPVQWNKLYPTGGSTVDSQSFDITLLSLLLGSICSLPTPVGGWNNLPATSSINKEDDIVRIRLYRNELYGHIKEAAISDSQFNKYWKDIEDVLGRLGGKHKQDIKELKVVSMDPVDQKYYTQCLKEWFMDEGRIMKELEQLTEQLEETKQEVKKVSNILQAHISGVDKESTSLDVELCSKNLKASTKQQTEFQPKLMASHLFQSARTDDIFTNLTIQRGRQRLRKRRYTGKMKHSVEYSQPTHVRTCQEIFTGPKGTSNPKSILVIGKPGIGKTIFCQKLVRDWANDTLFQDCNTVDFDFVYLLTFRQLNLLGDKELNMRELLNLLPFLDEHSSIDKFLFEYMIEHSNKVLFVLDGYDEYAHKNKIEEKAKENLEQTYVNNPRENMPVSVLVSKLMKKKIFSNATIVVTSRPQQADGLGHIHFDAKMEVTGFSPDQVKEFIEKHFHSKPKSIANRVLDHIVNNENLLDTAHIPMMCFLMCWCLESQIESNKENDLPNTVTELYSEVVRIFEMKHHSKSEYRTTTIPEQFQVPLVVKDTLNKLSKLAAETILIERFIFFEEDLQKFSISPEEIELLKASGLLTCGPGLRTAPFGIRKEYCFSHLTLHEYFAASEFVQNKFIPPSLHFKRPLVLVFMAGLLGRVKNENTMEQLLQIVILHDIHILLAISLFEYHDEEFGVKMIKKYCHRFRNIQKSEQLYLDFDLVADKDSTAVAYFLNLLCETNRQSKVQELNASSLGPFVLICDFQSQAVEKRVCESLKNQFCPVSSLRCDIAEADHECLFEALPNTNITKLHFINDHVGNMYVNFCQRLATVLATTNKVINLTIEANEDRFGCMDGFLKNLQDLGKVIQSTQLPTVTLEIGIANIDDETLQYVCDVLVPTTNITSLNITGNQITDKRLQYLSKALRFSSVTRLIIQKSESITNTGFEYLSDSLPSTNINALTISHVQMTSKGFQYLCDKLPSTRITTLHLSDCITDEGLHQLSETLPSTNITTLVLESELSTDEGLRFLCNSLPSTNVTTLTIHGPNFTDEGFCRLCQILPSTNVNSLEFAPEKQGLVHLCEALSYGKLTTLILDCDGIDDSDLQQLLKALESSRITTLCLSDVDEETEAKITGRLCELLPLMNITMNWS